MLAVPTVPLLEVPLATDARAAAPTVPVGMGRPRVTSAMRLARHGRPLSALGHGRRQAAMPLGHGLGLEASPVLCNPFPISKFDYRI
jgi:hypothetical protein